MTLLLFCSLLQCVCWSQPVAEVLAKAYKTFEGDPQLRGSIASLYVIDANSGKTIFDKNGRTGLAPASTQKVITSASAYALLGPDFMYQTRFGFSGREGGGTLVIEPSGDPTLGSWRWNQTGEDRTMQRIVSAYTKAGVKSYSNIQVKDTQWDDEAIPGGWIWQDIGNYYGAGAEGLNWRENQYDLILQSKSSIGSPVTIARAEPRVHNIYLMSKAQAAAKGTGDNAYIYFVPGTDSILVRGTIPVSQERFVISGAFPSAKRQFAATLTEQLRKQDILSNSSSSHREAEQGNKTFRLVHTELSPPLDSIIYWFNKKSINLYGEALVKTIAHKAEGAGTTDRGIEVLKDFWKTKGLESWEMGMVDGSGLSPLNRVTTHAMVTVLQYARMQPWFGGFYHALPEYNGMKLKSGTISGVKGFCGFHKSRDGKEYIVAFLVNNYYGASAQLVQKMYKVLDTLK
jgi:D-alanyl-D-alanine carboxypeptidase/D-alanyl-D-alanine-endopeptidase (penicillin-binding protein 4)